MPSLTAQKVLVIKEAKAPFFLSTMVIPKPGPDELLVKVQAASINPVDAVVQALDLLPNVQYPVILGGDAAGDVVEVGKDVQGYSKGDRVFFPSQHIKNYGGFQQYSLVGTRTVGKIPLHLSYAEAASIPLTFATAAFPLLAASPVGVGLNPTFDRKVSFAGEPTLVIGGGSSVGQFAIQILKFLGFTKIITYASKKHTEYLKFIGATHVIDRTEVSFDAIPRAVKEITSQPIKFAYNAFLVTPEGQKAAYACLAPNGTLASAHPSPPEDKDAKVEGKKVFGVYASTHIPSNREFGTVMWKELPKLIQEGTIKPNRVEILPGGLNGIADGCKRILSGGISGTKLIVNPQETE